MPSIELTFNNSLNTSVQIGDTVYFTSTQNVDMFDVTNINNVQEIGIITDITFGPPDIITINTALPMQTWPQNGSYIMFSKDNKVNLSTLTGYYAEVKLTNNSSKEIELFSLASDVEISSK